MERFLLILSILVVGFTFWNEFKNPFPQFTDTELQIIYMEEGI